LADPRSWHPRSGALNAADYRDADLGQKLPMSVPTRTTPIELVGSGMGSLSAAQVADQLPAMLGGLLDGTIATEFDPTPFDLLSTNRSRPQPRSVLTLRPSRRHCPSGGVLRRLARRFRIPRTLSRRPRRLRPARIPQRSLRG